MLRIITPIFGFRLTIWAGGFNAVQQRHRNVHDHDFGIGGVRQSHRFAAIARFAHDLHSGLPFQQETNAFAHHPRGHLPAECEYSSGANSFGSGISADNTVPF